MASPASPEARSELPRSIMPWSGTSAANIMTSSRPGSVHVPEAGENSLASMVDFKRLAADMNTTSAPALLNRPPFSKPVSPSVEVFALQPEVGPSLVLGESTPEFGENQRRLSIRATLPKSSTLH